MVRRGAATVHVESVAVAAGSTLRREVGRARLVAFAARGELTATVASGDERWHAGDTVDVPPGSRLVARAVTDAVVIVARVLVMVS